MLAKSKEYQIHQERHEQEQKRIKYVYRITAGKYIYVGQSSSTDYLHRIYQHIANAYGIVYDYGKVNRDETEEQKRLVRTREWAHLSLFDPRKQEHLTEEAKQDILKIQQNKLYEQIRQRGACNCTYEVINLPTSDSEKSSEDGYNEFRKEWNNTYLDYYELTNILNEKIYHKNMILTNDIFVGRHGSFKPLITPIRQTIGNSKNPLARAIKKVHSNDITSTNIDNLSEETFYSALVYFFLHSTETINNNLKISAQEFLSKISFVENKTYLKCQEILNHAKDKKNKKAELNDMIHTIITKIINKDLFTIMFINDWNAWLKSKKIPLVIKLSNNFQIHWSLKHQWTASNRSIITSVEGIYFELVSTPKKPLWLIKNQSYFKVKPDQGSTRFGLQQNVYDEIRYDYMKHLFKLYDVYIDHSKTTNSKKDEMRRWFIFDSYITENWNLFYDNFMNVKNGVLFGPLYFSFKPNTDGEYTFIRSTSPVNTKTLFTGWADIDEEEKNEMVRNNAAQFNKNVPTIW